MTLVGEIESSEAAHQEKINADEEERRRIVSKQLRPKGSMWNKSES